MQSLLADSFNRSKKDQPNKQTKKQNSQEEQQQQQQQSKRQFQDQNENQNQNQNESQNQQSKVSKQQKNNKLAVGSQKQQEQLEPMKDAFDSDQSYLIVTQEIKEEKVVNEAVNSNGMDGGSGLRNGGYNGGENGGNLSNGSNGAKSKKIVKARKEFQWKNMWVKQANAVKGSKPIWIKKWVRVAINYPQANQQNMDQQIIQNKQNDSIPLQKVQQTNKINEITLAS